MGKARKGTREMRREKVLGGAREGQEREAHKGKGEAQGEEEGGGEEEEDRVEVQGG